MRYGDEILEPAAFPYFHYRGPNAIFHADCFPSNIQYTQLQASVQDCLDVRLEIAELLRHLTCLLQNLAFENNSADKVEFLN